MPRHAIDSADVAEMSPEDLLQATAEMPPLDRAETLIRALETGEFVAYRDTFMAAIRGAIDAEREQLDAVATGKAVDWLKEKWGDDRECPYCGNPYWAVGPPVTFRSQMGRTPEPVFSAECTNCGHTVWINAVRAGIIGGDPE